MQKITGYAFSFAVALSLAVMAGIILSATPPNLDGYIHYHSLACWHYPNSYLNSFRDTCDGDLDLTILHRWNWPRAYRYVGSAYSALYYPVFLLWPHWNSAVLLGILIMVPGLLAASSLLKVRFSILLLVMGGTYPVLFYILRDYGQLTLQFSLLFILPWLAQNAITASGKKWILYSVNAGLFLAFGVEAKPVLLYFIPSIAIVTLAAIWPLKPDFGMVRLVFKRLWPGLLLSAVLLVILFTSHTERGWMYYQSLSLMTPKNSGIGAIPEHAGFLLLHYWFNFLNASGYVYGLKPMDFFDKFDWRGFLLTLPFWLVLFIAKRSYDKILCNDTASTRSNYLLTGLLLACLTGILTISSNTLGVHPHHILQPFYYLLGALAIMLQAIWDSRRNFALILSGILIFSQFLCALVVSLQTPLVKHDWERIRMLEFIQNAHLNENTVIDHLDWGVYYISSLYGPKDQIILYRAALNEAYTIALSTNRYVVFTKRKQSKWTADWPLYQEKLNKQIPGLHRIYPNTFSFSPHAGEWEVWTNAPSVTGESIK